MQQKLDYIHYNPVAAGFVDEPEHYRYSSAKDYAGKKGDADKSVAAAETSTPSDSKSEPAAAGESKAAMADTKQSSDSVSADLKPSKNSKRKREQRFLRQV